MIDGWIESVSKIDARGWVFDRDRPSDHIEVIARANGVEVGRSVADRFRSDLVEAGIGRGDHGFAVPFFKTLENDFVGAIEVFANIDGAEVRLEVWQAFQGRSPIVSTFSGDETQYPVFILGATRSGTTAVAEALRRATRYSGYGEGHIIGLLARLSGSVTAFYEENRREASTQNTLIAQVPIEFFEGSFDRIMAEVARKAHRTRYWFDKTPNAQTVMLAPRLKQIWPNAKFIFMKRRALEYLVSRERKFPDFDFQESCEKWVEVIEAWDTVHLYLQGSSIELDQHTLAHDPSTAASEIGLLLGLSGQSMNDVAASLLEGRPEQTSRDLKEALSYDALEWDEIRRELFETICWPTMRRLGYSMTAGYWMEHV